MSRQHTSEKGVAERYHKLLMWSILYLSCQGKSCKVDASTGSNYVKIISKPEKLNTS